MNQHTSDGNVANWWGNNSVGERSHNRFKSINYFGFWKFSAPLNLDFLSHFFKSSVYTNFWKSRIFDFILIRVQRFIIRTFTRQTGILIDQTQIHNIRDLNKPKQRTRTFLNRTQRLLTYVSWSRDWSILKIHGKIEQWLMNWLHSVLIQPGSVHANL